MFMHPSILFLHGIGGFDKVFMGEAEEVTVLDVEIGADVNDFKFLCLEPLVDVHSVTICCLIVTKITLKCCHMNMNIFLLVGSK